MVHSQDRVLSNQENYFLETIEAHKKYPTKTILPQETFRNMPTCSETYAISRAMLLSLWIFYWCYYSLQHGPRQFTILKNEQVLSGFVFSKKAVISFSYGYSTWNCAASAATAIMFIYSIISERPRFSLPLIGFFLTEMIYDVCNIIIMMWLVFSNLQLRTALSYVAMLFLIILAEIWMWLGAVQLYEHRSYGSC